MLLNCRSAKKHAADIYDLSLTHKFGIAILTETWLNSSSHPIIDLLVLPSHKTIRLDRPKKSSGAIACIYRKTLAVSQAETIILPEFEYLDIKITSNIKLSCKLDAFYHPPGDNLPVIEQIMESITTNDNSQVSQIFLRDFNLHCNGPKDQAVNSLKSFISDHELTQICNSPTHIKGKPLDLIISKTDNITLESISPCDWTDHYRITFLIDLRVTPKRAQPNKTQQWKRNQ